MTDIWSRIELAILKSGKHPSIVLVGMKEQDELRKYPRLDHTLDPNVKPFAVKPIEVRDVEVGCLELVYTGDDSRLTLVFDKEEVE